jgi:transcriptional regulator with XRE-family HTH domain
MNTALSYLADSITIKLMLSKKDFTEKLGENIRKARISKGLSQEELAHRAGLYRTYPNHVERGRYSPSAYILYKIAKALGIKGGELLP